MKRVLFRANYSAIIGLGHVSRCIALASILRKKFKTGFITNGINPSLEKKIRLSADFVCKIPLTDDIRLDAKLTANRLKPQDIVVLDGYDFGTIYQKELLKKKCKIVCIDDIHDSHFISDAVINHAESIKKTAYSNEKHTTLYLGFKYAIINPVFLKAAGKKTNTITKQPGEYFINMGGSDSPNNTYKIIRACLRFDKLKKIRVVIGKLYPHKKELFDLANRYKSKIMIYIDISPDQISRLLQKCEVAICPASTISIESCAIGIGLITGITAYNQTDIYNSLIKTKCAFGIGNINNQSELVLSGKIRRYIRNKNKIKNNINNQKQLIDGRSPERLLAIFESLSESND